MSYSTQRKAYFYEVFKRQYREFSTKFEDKARLLVLAVFIDLNKVVANQTPIPVEEKEKCHTQVVNFFECVTNLVNSSFFPENDDSAEISSFDFLGFWVCFSNLAKLLSDLLITIAVTEGASESELKDVEKYIASNEERNLNINVSLEKFNEALKSLLGFVGSNQ